MKTITMMELRKHPGEYAFRVRADGESFLVTYQGKIGGTCHALVDRAKWCRGAQ